MANKEAKVKTQPKPVKEHPLQEQAKKRPDLKVVTVGDQVISYSRIKEV
jgi:hypothetical protein